MFLGMDFWLKRAQWVAEGWCRAWVPRAVTLLPNAPGLETWTGVSISRLSSWRPDYSGRSSNLVNASLFIQIKQFSRREPKKKPVMSRKRTWTWPSCTEMSTVCVLFKRKRQFWFWPLFSPAHRVQAMDFSVLSGSLRGILIQPFSNSLKI